MSVTSKTNCRITFLGQNTDEEIKKIVSIIDLANEMVLEYFGVYNTYDIIVCKDNWAMEVQILSRQKSPTSYSAKFVGMTDYQLREIIIRSDKARFAHYLHELVHGVIAPSHPHQLREALAWHFTIKILEPHKEKVPYPSWIEPLYLSPLRKLVSLLGDDVLKDLALGKKSIENVDTLPQDVKVLFLPEESFYFT